MCDRGTPFFQRVYKCGTMATYDGGGKDVGNKKYQYRFIRTEVKMNND